MGLTIKGDKRIKKERRDTRRKRKGRWNGYVNIRRGSNDYYYVGNMKGNLIWISVYIEGKGVNKDKKGSIRKRR